MKDFEMIFAAEATIKKYCIAEQITIPNIHNRILQWASKLFISDSLTLAALALSGEFDPDITPADTDYIRNFFFPSSLEVSLENI